MTAIMRNDCRGKLLLLCVVRIRMRVLSLHIGKAAFPAWIRADSWLPALPTASPWATALGWWTPRRPPTAWRPIWWTAQQVTLAALCFWGLSSPFPLLLLGWYHWACKSNSSSRIIWWKGGKYYFSAAWILAPSVKTWELHYILCKLFLFILCLCNMWTYFKCHWRLLAKYIH